jgi:hypothetical protein
LFESPNSGILKISILVYDRGEDDGHLPIVRGIQKGIRRLNLAVQIRTQHHPRISERFDQIDYEECGPVTESNSETKAPLSKEFLVRLCCLVSGHKTLNEIGLEGVARVPDPSAGIVSRFIPCRCMFRHSLHRMESWDQPICWCCIDLLSSHRLSEAVFPLAGKP